MCLSGGLCTLVLATLLASALLMLASITMYLARGAPCSEGLLSCLPAVTILKFLVLTLNSCIGSEVPWVKGSCMWAEEIHTGWMSTVHIVFTVPRELRLVAHPQCTDTQRDPQCAQGKPVMAMTKWGTAYRGYAFCAN